MITQGKRAVSCLVERKIQVFKLFLTGAEIQDKLFIWILIIEALKNLTDTICFSKSFLHVFDMVISSVSSWLKVDVGHGILV